jgi:hypothetical protein
MQLLANLLPAKFPETFHRLFRNLWELSMGASEWRYKAERPGYRGKAEAGMRLDVRDTSKRGTLQTGSDGVWS